MNYMRDFVRKTSRRLISVDPEGTYLTWVDFSGYGFTDEELEHYGRRSTSLVRQR